MINLKSDIKFTNFFKFFNIFSIFLITISLSSIFLKGLNFGVDFKGGTLIEVRVENNQVKISEIRQSFLKMNLGDVTVKKFGKNNDYLIKFEKINKDKENFIEEIKNDLSMDIGSNVTFRRVENVGPKVSNELLKAGLLAISLSLAAMLFCLLRLIYL